MPSDSESARDGDIVRDGDGEADGVSLLDAVRDGKTDADDAMGGETDGDDAADRETDGDAEELSCDGELELVSDRDGEILTESEGETERVGAALALTPRESVAVDVPVGDSGESVALILGDTLHEADVEVDALGEDVCAGERESDGEANALDDDDCAGDREDVRETDALGDGGPDALAMGLIKRRDGLTVAEGGNSDISTKAYAAPRE